VGTLAKNKKYVVNEDYSNETEYNTLWDLWHGKGHLTTGMTGNDKAEMLMLSGMTFDDPIALTMLDREDLPDDMQQFLQQNPASLISGRPFDAESRAKEVKIRNKKTGEVDNVAENFLDTYFSLKGENPSDWELIGEAKEDFDFDAAEPARAKLLLDGYKSGEDWVSDPQRSEAEDGSFEGWLIYSKKFNLDDQLALFPILRVPANIYHLLHKTIYYP